MYRVLILPRAGRQLTKMKSAYDRISAALTGLGHNPRPLGCKKLVARDGWRIRVGDHRVIYEIDDRKHEVLILDIGQRKDIY